MKETKAFYWELLQEKLPEETLEKVQLIIKEVKVDFKISKPRKTKLGDFKVLSNMEKPQISINENLSPYHFLVTLIHELAHYFTWIQYKNKVAPHGKEWKNNYRTLFTPILSEIKDTRVKKMLSMHINNARASSFSDIDLMKLINNDTEQNIVENMPFEAYFKIGNKIYRKEKKLRKRYLCVEYHSKKKYYIHPLAKVERTEV